MFNEFILQPFLNTLNKFPKRNAFCINDIFFTYEELAKWVYTISHAIKKTAYPGEHIALVVNDDIQTYASILAIWSRGYAYVPLHPHHPIGRNLEITESAKAGLILDSNPDSLFNQTDKIIIITSELPEINYHEDTLLFDGKDVSDAKTAYILFTSGSTGTPKGVVISRGNLGAFMKAFWGTGIHVNETDKCLQCFDLTFDVSIQSFLVPLTRGACTFTIPHDQIKFSYAYNLLEEEQITFSAMPPSLIRYLRPYFEEINLPYLRCNIMTAEASPVDLLQDWSKCIPNAEIYDFYGPTEATIYCTYYKFDSKGNNKQLNGMLSIGKPMPGIRAIIINEKNNLCKTGQKGQLCISGPQVTPGYWKNETKNKHAFFDKEINGELSRFYMTGDSCFFDKDGDIMLAGRNDQQIKIQGYRIEPGEIEYHARQFLKGQNTIVLPFTNKTGNTELALFIEGHFNEKVKLLNYLGEKLPKYMIPAKIMVEKLFPLNKNGKVDRLKLKGKIK